MKAHLFDYHKGPITYTGKIPIESPIVINNLEEWISEHTGPVMIYPPDENRDYWLIYVTDESKRFIKSKGV